MVSHQVFRGLALFLLQTLVAGSPINPSSVPTYFRDSLVTRRDLSVLDVMKELGNQLSPTTTIIGPSDPKYEEVTARWNIIEKPNIEVVVQVGQEKDIAKVVKYCNANSIDFMAVNRGHSNSYESAKKFKGVQIDLKQLVGITIQSDKKSVILQAGVWGKEIMATLWEKGYVASTGSHECIGFFGPALGGGHGRYEGQYGLVGDNLISLNVVLADGSTIEIDKKSHSDLYWAMNGAGHNFGIVTSGLVRIYPRKIDTWHYHNYIWSGDKIDAIFNALNAFHDNGKTPPKMGANAGALGINPAFSNTTGTYFWSFAYAGSAKEAEKLLEPFNKIGALHEDVGDVPYPEIAAIQGTDVARGGCGPARRTMAHSLLQRYNATTERGVYDLFVKTMNENPKLASGSTVLYEGYSTKAVEKIPQDSTAYAHRHEYHILYAMTIIPEGSNLEGVGQGLVDEIHRRWDLGRKSATYINYATGKETLESTYGYEPWRLDRLRKLKTKYDPNNRFRYYIPINPQK